MMLVPGRRLYTCVLDGFCFGILTTLFVLLSYGLLKRAIDWLLALLISKPPW